MDDLKLIKKYYGEKMMHLSRELFPTILETPGLLYKLINDNFAHYKYLADDIIKSNQKYNFKDFIDGLIDNKRKKIVTNKSAYELLRQEGYQLFECKTESDIQSFKKYYSESEKLCTFKGGRLQTCYVFFAVKDNIDEIKREDFKNPRREDEYGISIISIQFKRGKVNTLSIKNRYNHTVKNADATYSNNLESIAEGLTSAFENDYKLNINQNEVFNFELPSYVKANDGKYYKYNYEIDNVYYCPNNIIIDEFNVIDKYLEKEKYLVLDYFILDLVNKSISLYESNTFIKDICDYKLSDSFINFNSDIKKITIKKDKTTKNKEIIIASTKKDIIINIDKDNNIIGYSNKNLITIEDDFLIYNTHLKYIDLENVKQINNYFLYNNDSLEKICLKNVKTIGNDFLTLNKSIKNISLLNVEQIKDGFLTKNKLVSKVIMPNIKSIKDNFMSDNNSINYIEMPKLEKIGQCFLRNTKINKVSFPSLTYIDNNFMDKNFNLESIDIPKLQIVKNNFLTNNLKLKKISFPNLEVIGNNFISGNNLIESVYLPKLKIVKNSFIQNGGNIKELSLPSIYKIGSKFLYGNRTLLYLDVPKLSIIGDSFMSYNNSIKNLDLPCVETIGEHFLIYNKSINSLFMPKVKNIDNDFLTYNSTLDNIYMPNLTKINKNFLRSNNVLKSIDIPLVKNIDDNFMEYNNSLVIFNALKLKKIGNNFLKFNKVLLKAYTPSLEKIGASAIKKNKIVKIEGKNSIILNKRLSYYIDRLFINFNYNLKVRFTLYKIYNDNNKIKVLDKK